MSWSGTVRTWSLAASAALLGTVGVLLLPSPASAIVDGVPLYPHGVDAAYSMTSMENADLSGPMLAFEALWLESGSFAPEGRRAVTKSATAAIVGWNTATGLNWPIGQDGQSLPASADQRQPTVLDLNGDVLVVWQQRNDPGKSTWDLWLWRGSEKGKPRAGYPKLLVSGPALSNQRAADLGRCLIGSSTHPVVAWVDDRDSAGVTDHVYWLDLFADADDNNTIDIEEAGWDPVDAGTSADRSGSLLKDQHDPAVGADGVYWLDDRTAAQPGEASVFRADLSRQPPQASLFCAEPAGDKNKLNLRASEAGASWLGPGIAGGPWEPWAKVPGGTAGIVTALANPTAFDLWHSRYAIAAGHGGNTDGDEDIFLYDALTGQSTPVCNVGGTSQFAYNKLKRQTMPTISEAAGGSRVVWSDSRQHTNTQATAWNSLAWELYVALVPTVSLSTTATSANYGRPITLATTVSPNFAGKDVSFQVGLRSEVATAYGTLVWYPSWKTLATRTLRPASTAAFAWTPSSRGTYYVRVWFPGGKKYTDVGKRKVPHAPMASRVVKLVVQ